MYVQTGKYVCVSACNWNVHIYSHEILPFEQDYFSPSPYSCHPHADQLPIYS